MFNYMIPLIINIALDFLFLFFVPKWRKEENGEWRNGETGSSFFI